MGYIELRIEIYQPRGDTVIFGVETSTHLTNTKQATIPLPSVYKVMLFVTVPHLDCDFAILDTKTLPVSQLFPVLRLKFITSFAFFYSTCTGSQ